MTTEATLSKPASGSIRAHTPTAWGFARDVISLTKPRLTSLVVITTAGGMWLSHNALRHAHTQSQTQAQHSPETLHFGIALMATTLAVGAANTLNCYLERDLDRHMARTRLRPLPSGRMSPRTALTVGLILSLLSVPMLCFGVNPITGLLGGLAIASYVLVYTPMKTRSPAALVLGAIPGALPPLMGSTAVTGSITLGGVCLFALLFFWQMPHFLAIAIYRQDEYAAAGMKVMTLSRPLSAVRWQILGWTLGLVPVSLSLCLVGVAGRGYFLSALALGAGFVGFALKGFSAAQPRRWARQLFLYSLGYLTGIFLALWLDALRP